MKAAEGGSNAINDPVTWINFGVLGLLFVAAILGFIYFKPSVEKMLEERDRLIKERDKMADQRDAMSSVLQEKLLPIVSDFVSTTRALLPVLQEIQHLQALTPMLQELLTQQDELIRQRGGSFERDETPPQRQRRRS